MGKPTFSPRKRTTTSEITYGEGYSDSWETIWSLRPPPCLGLFLDMWRCRRSAKYFGTSAHASGGDLQRCEVRRQRCRIRLGAPSSCQHSYLKGQPIRGGKDWNVTPGFPCCDSKVWQPVEVKRKKDEGLTGLLSRFLLVRWQKISLWLWLGGRPLSSSIIAVAIHYRRLQAPISLVGAPP